MLAITDSAKRIREYPECASSRGILICLQERRSLTSSYILIRMLRRHGCALPVELWLPSGGQDTEADNQVFLRYDVAIRVAPADISARLSLLRLHATVHSGFREVLVLEPSNLPLRCPAYLFDEEAYRLTGAIFWRDYQTWDCEIHRIIGLTMGCCGLKWDGGQFLLDRAKAWEAINLALVLFRDFSKFGDIVPREIDAWMAAWHILGQCVTNSGLTPEALGPLRDTRRPWVICHGDLRGERLFQNRSGLPWCLHGFNPRVPGALFEGECRYLLEELRDLPDWPVPRLRSEASSIDILQKLLHGHWLISVAPTSNAKPLERGNRDVPLAHRIICFSDNGTLGQFSFSEITYWTLHHDGGCPELKLYDDEGSLGFSFRLSAEMWVGCKLGAVGQTRATLKRIVDVFPGARPPVAKLALRDIGNQISGKSGAVVRVINSSFEIKDHIGSLYACTGAARAGAFVRFETPFATWFSRIEEPRLTIVQVGDAVAFSDDVGVIDLHSEAIVNAAYGLSKARWYSSIIHPELAPCRPEKVDNVVRSERLPVSRYIVIAPCSGDSSQEWPAVHWARLVHLMQEAGFEVVGVGAVDEEERLAAIFGDTNAFWVVVESQEWLADVLLKASSVVAVENDIAHFAGLLEVFTIVLHSHYEATYLWDCTSVTGLTPKTECVACRLQASRLYEPGCSRGCSALYTVSPEAVLASLGVLNNTRTGNGGDNHDEW